ncbi:MAG: 2,3-diphosphoglycerate synthetase [Actinobacteria bacterium]|nr:2,3-diphosphoglycerate synthetase [Actinomycetota bacterium]
MDGEHYPAVTHSALEDVASSGHEIAAAVLVGGKEKLPSGGLDALGEWEIVTGTDQQETLDRAIVEFQPDAVLDLSDEPVLDYRRRHRLISVALARGVPYEGADFAFSPPPRPRLCTRPSIAIIGTGKRTGKTAITGFVARTMKEAGSPPVVVAMGRGGPPEPEVMRGDEVDIEAKDLLEIVDQGRHAASDYIEDALLGRVPTVGCRRCGGGLAGGVDVSNVAEGVRVANDLPGDAVILEGSGSAIPPVHADVSILVVPSSCPTEFLSSYMGPYRLLLSDFVVLTMCEEPFGSPSQISAITSEIRSSFRTSKGEGSQPEIEIIRTVFRPVPTRSVEGRNVFVATTAPEAAGGSIKTHLEEEQGCDVVGISHALSDRDRLETDIGRIAEKADTLLCEIKAAGIDVATRRAMDAGMDVVYMDNVPTSVDGDDPAEFVMRAYDLARRRFEQRER